MKYSEAVKYLEELPRFTRKHGLEQTRAFLDRLGAPDERMAEQGTLVAHVAGTNGKGSVCQYLSEMFLAAGAHVALFTSPHLVDTRERIRFDRKEIPKEAFCRLLDEVREKAGSGEDGPTYFETLFLIAELWFAKQNPDVVILETGLGGRLDATNVVRHKDVCVITRIGLDHMQYLGNTVAAIAGEKAGILRPGVPAVVLSEPEEARKVFEARARLLPCPLFVVKPEDFSVRPADGRSIDFSLRYRYDCKDFPGEGAAGSISSAGLCSGTAENGAAGGISAAGLCSGAVENDAAGDPMQPGSAPWLTAGPSYETAAGGAAELQIDARLRTPALYQGENASLALVAAGLFRGGRGAYRNGSQVSSSEQAMAGGSSLPAVSEPERHDVLSERVMARGISEAFWEGRMEEILPGVFLDGGHNPDGIGAFLQSAAAVPLPAGGRRLLLFSAVSDKQVGVMAKEILDSGLFAQVVAVPMQNERGLSAERLGQFFRDAQGAGRSVVVPESVPDGFRTLLAEKRPEDLVFAAGSLYLVGMIKELCGAGMNLTRASGSWCPEK